MRLPGRRTLLAVRRWLGSRFRERALVLGYHRIDEPAHDPFGLAVSADAFRRQVEHVRSRARIVRLADLVRDVKAGSVTHRSVALTFDDAYGSSMAALVPLLEELAVPATVFVPTGLIGDEPWWDRLERITHRPGPGPSRLSAPGGPIVVPDGGPTAALTSLYDALRLLDDHPRREVLDALDDAWPGAATPGAESHRIVTESELRALADSDLVDIGSHSHSHPFLATVPTERQRTEIVQSKRTLEELLGRPVDLFSYPNGSCTAVTTALVRDAGYLGACASQPNVVTAARDPYRLPRIWPRDDPSDVLRATRLWLR